MGTPFETLVTDALAQPLEGWHFAWLAGRATEQRPSWGYSALLAERLAGSSAALDVQTGGGETYAGAVARASRRPGLVVATESWRPSRGGRT